MVDSRVVFAMGVYLEGHIEKAHEFAPKKLFKKVSKRGLVDRAQFDAWLDCLRTGDDAIRGYKLNDNGHIVRDGNGLAMAPSKRKKSRKASRPESSVEVEPLGAFRKSAPTVPASPAKEVPTPKPPSRKKVEKEDSRKASKPKAKVVDGGDGGDGGGDDEEPKKKKRKAGRPPKPAGASEPTDTWRTSVKRENVKTGKWSADEQRQLTAAIKAYAVAHDHNPGDLDWLIGKKHSHEEGRGMWKEICAALPNRSIKAVAAAALRLHHPYAGAGQFTQDEDDALRGLVLNHGNKWTDFSPILKRTPEACRLRWRDIKNVETRSTGKWSELEEQQLKDAVTKYGNPSSHKGDGSDKRLLLDNIDWEAVLPHVPTRTRTQCVAKWYLRLAPSMCERGIWAKGDDKRLMTSLFKLRKQQPAGKQWHESAVPWDSLVQDRTGDECKRRWAFMKKNVPDANNKDLAQIVLELVNSNFRSLLQK